MTVLVTVGGALAAEGLTIAWAVRRLLRPYRAVVRGRALEQVDDRAKEALRR